MLFGVTNKETLNARSLRKHKDESLSGAVTKQISPNSAAITALRQIPFQGMEDEQ